MGLKWKLHRDRIKTIENGCFTIYKLGCLVKQNKKYFYFFTTQNLGAVAADLLYKFMPGLGLSLIISRAAKAGPKQHSLSLSVYNNLYGKLLKADSHKA